MEDARVTGGERGVTRVAEVLVAHPVGGTGCAYPALRGAQHGCGIAPRHDPLGEPGGNGHDLLAVLRMVAADADRLAVCHGVSLSCRTGRKKQLCRLYAPPLSAGRG